MSRRKIDDKKAEWIWKKWQEGYTQDAIAKALNVNKQTIYRTVGRLQDAGRILVLDGRTKKDGTTLSYDC